VKGREQALLAPEDARRFMATDKQVATAVHQLLRRAIPADPRQLLLAARQQLQQQPDLLGRAVKQLHRRQLQPDGEVIEALRQLHPSPWLFLNDLRSGAIFLDRECQAAYSVAGLTQSPGQIIGPGGYRVETALCPFAGRILCDGIFADATPMDPELERRCRERYLLLKSEGRVIRDPAGAPLWTSAESEPQPQIASDSRSAGRQAAGKSASRRKDDSAASSSPSCRQRPSTAGNAGEHQLLQAKLANLVTRQRYSQAIRVREQALRRHPDLDLRPGEAQLWCLEGRQALAEGQPQRAETALTKAVDLGLPGEPHYLLARLWLERGQPERGLALLQESFEAGTLPVEYAGAYLKLLLISGQPERVRDLVRQQPKRFQSQQIHWAAGVLSLQAGDFTNARRQFRQMTGPASPGDFGGVWRAWAALEAGDATAAAAALQKADHPASRAVALSLAARTDQRPGELLELERRDLPRRELALALNLLHQLRQQNLLNAGLLLLSHERPLLAAVPELAALRRPLLLLAGQQALEREAPNEAIRCWRPIVDRPCLDPDLALRLYPLLDQGGEEHWPEAERLASQLLGWVRRSARDNSAAWPQPLLSHTQARLHCWQTDQHLRLGMRQQVRRSAEQAQQLAPELPDVIGRQGMLAYVMGEDSRAISLLWQALDNGCRGNTVYDVLDEALEESGQQAERLRLQREHGPSFGFTPQPAGEQAVLPTWLDALSQDDAPSMATKLSLTPERGPVLEVLRIFVDHVLPPGGSANGGPASFDPRKVTLDLVPATIRWDTLIAALPATDRVQAITAILVATHRFAVRTGKAMRGQIESRLAELEELAAEPGTAHAEQALQNLLLLAGLRLRRQEALRQEAARLLRRSHQPERLLSRALLDLHLLTTTKPWQAIVDDLHRQDPQNPLLLLALATMQRTFTTPYERLADQAFGLARRLQDGEALAACRRERWWAEESDDRKIARLRAQSMQQHPGWQQLIDSFDIRGMLEAKAREEGMEPISEEQLQAMLPDLERRMAEAFARTNGRGLNAGRIESGTIDKEEDNGEDGRAPRQRGRRRTFMDL
jgi:tetratricopeptide (TPR) repeat protein